MDPGPQAGQLVHQVRQPGRPHLVIHPRPPPLLIRLVAASPVDLELHHKGVDLDLSRGVATLPPISPDLPPVVALAKTRLHSKQFVWALKVGVGDPPWPRLDPVRSGGCLRLGEVSRGPGAGQ